MNGKMRSSVMGLILGEFSSPLPMAQKEPVAYLYNGVRLPDINTVWTDEMEQTHPYAMIMRVLGKTSLLLVQCAPYYDTSNDTIYVTGNSILYIPDYNYAAGRKCWKYVGEATSRLFDRDDFVWTSHDILYKDSTEVLFAASEPIPVYE